jgi:hypothetical protein
MDLKCAFANILLISFIFNFKFMFCTCINVVDLIFVDFRFYSFRIEICKIFITSKFEFPPFVSIKMLPCLKLDKLIVYLWKGYIYHGVQNTIWHRNFVSTNLEIFHDTFHFCLNKLNFLYCLKKTFFPPFCVIWNWLQLLCQSALP